MEHVHIVSVQSMFFYFYFIWHCWIHIYVSSPHGAAQSQTYFTVPILLLSLLQCCCLVFVHVYVFVEYLHVHLCHLVFLSFFCFCFCPVIQFESTRSSSPTECCRFSPWSRKVVVPPSLLPPASCVLLLTLYFATPHLFLFVWLLPIYITNLFWNACPLNAVPLRRRAPTCLLWNRRESTALQFHPRWRVIHLRTQTVVALSVQYVRNVWGPQSQQPGFL